MLEGVNVDLLVVPDCPNEAVAIEALHEASQLAGLTSLAVTVTVVATDEQAQRRGFIGSPTFLLNGADPFAVTGGPTGVSCRLYPTAGGPSAVPEVAALRDALVRACASRSSAAGGR